MVGLILSASAQPKGRKMQSSRRRPCRAATHPCLLALAPAPLPMLSFHPPQNGLHKVGGACEVRDWARTFSCYGLCRALGNKSGAPHASIPCQINPSAGACTHVSTYHCRQALPAASPLSRSSWRPAAGGPQKISSWCHAAKPPALIGRGALHLGSQGLLLTPGMAPPGAKSCTVAL